VAAPAATAAHPEERRDEETPVVVVEEDPAPVDTARGEVKGAVRRKG
jgi:hypothetical protein